MEKRFAIPGGIAGVQFTKTGNEIQAKVSENELHLSFNRMSANEWIVIRDDRQTRLFIARNKDGVIYVHYDGEVFALKAAQEDFGDVGGGEEKSDGRMSASMPGKVIKILVSAGDGVSKGQPVLILESMKMETTQEAPFDGKVVEVNSGPGQQVDAGDVIVRLEPVESEEEE